MIKKRNESWRKAGMIVFLLMIVIGFSVPLLLNPADQNAPKVVEPRVCQHDSDCYLTCDSGAISTLCYQNLCVQNSCAESSPFPYQPEAASITLTLVINRQKILLSNQTSSADFFVQFEEDSVKLFSNRLSLAQILEKTGISTRFPCLTYLGVPYCVDDGHKLQFFVNGQESYQYENYLPKAGDTIQIEYASTSFDKK